MSKMMVLGGEAFGRGFTHEGRSGHEMILDLWEQARAAFPSLFSVLCGYNEKTAEEKPHKNSTMLAPWSQVSSL